ncbi:DUF7221 family queuine tRNA-ribosyltransferase-like protein [Nocardia sp. CA-128927]|uniref:deazapurine DNA modification protein DpdA family protein n=1 Tax=Nocardia sp. CA-128927 TaxID=3239975 RepID=UPI003D957734
MRSLLTQNSNQRHLLLSTPAASIERCDTAWGPLTPWTTSADHLDPARRMLFFLGIGQPSLMTTSPVPVFVSAKRLAHYRSRGEKFPVKAIQAPYAGDSGAYSAIMLTADPRGHPWWAHPDEYGALWTRLIEDIGPPLFVGIQDVPCEPGCLRFTGSTTSRHQQATLENYLYLSEQFDFVPWLPTLQGWHPHDYIEHYHRYLEAGIDLTARWVGIGSICRKNRARDVARVLAALAPLGMKMHGYGVSLNALALTGHLLHSSDSQAWSMTSRTAHIRLPGCGHQSRPDPVTGERVITDCRNCFRYALYWREKAMDALRACAERVATADPGLWSDPVPALPIPRPPRRTAATGVRSGVPASDQISLFDALPTRAAPPHTIAPHSPPSATWPERKKFVCLRH